MKEAILNVVVKNDSCCPKLDTKTRLIGFGITFLLGIVLLIMSLGALPGLVVGGSSFAIFFTLGNISCLGR
jgi:hypothetical protein